MKYKTVCIIGPPKTGTTHLLRSLMKGNFSNIAPGLNEYNGIINPEETYDYKVLKNPMIAFDPSWRQLANLQKAPPDTLFIGMVRPYNEAMFSLYKHWRGGVIPKDLPYSVFLAIQGTTWAALENNFLTFKETFNHFVLVDFNSILNIHPEKIFSDLNIDFKIENKIKWSKHTAKKQEEHEISKYLTSAYNKLKNNKDLQKIWYNNEKWRPINT